MSAFGIVIPGRKVETEFQQVDANKFLITVDKADSLNHVVVFLTGVTPILPGLACCLFFSMPDALAPPNWHYLGYITNEKPSAIFKLSNLTKQNQQIGTGVIGDTDLVMDEPNQPVFNFAQAPVVSLAQIGISVEPIETVAQLVAAVDTTASKVDSFSLFMTKTVENLYNYCASFARPASDIIANVQCMPLSTQFIPLSSIQSWYENYTRKLSNDKNFWKSIN